MHLIYHSTLFAYRTLKQESTKQTPFYLVHGREAQLPIDMEFQELNLTPVENFDESLRRRISALKGVFTDAQIINHQNIQRAQDLQKLRQQNLKKAQTYKVNDIVLVYDSAKQNLHGGKFEVKWAGPYWIDKKLGNNAYLIRNKTGILYKSSVHAERLKHYKQRQLVEPHVIIYP